MIRTGNDSPKRILKLTGSTGRLVRWRLSLLDHDFDVFRRAGVKHQGADALSRLRTIW